MGGNEIRKRRLRIAEIRPLTHKYLCGRELFVVNDLMVAGERTSSIRSN